MKTKRNLWPYGIIAAFALFIAGTTSLVVLATKQKSDLIDGNYYEQEIRYQTRLDSLNRANGLSVPATVKYDSASNRIEIALPPQHALATGKVELYRPSENGLDRSMSLATDSHGIQQVDATTLQPGLWKVRLTWKVGAQDFSLEQKIIVKKS